ncbi:hypothetical protein [Psychrobacter sp. HII-4]|uniref:hypothetical protein n=1 Tax=Psychrobacter sp. HII-4 TaxID=1569264 RepID=UPI0022342869|nr:hypothetical protein [Psychrobacter sp. HII-4]
MKSTFYTIVALIAFAANSLFCRMALAEGYIDACTTLRLLSAAMSLAVVMSVHTYWLHQQKPHQKNLHLNTATDDAILQDKGSWISSISLVVYALCFSIAYTALDTGTGALILFSAVQLTIYVIVLSSVRLLVHGLRMSLMTMAKGFGVSVAIEYREYGK